MIDNYKKIVFSDDEGEPDSDEEEEEDVEEEEEEEEEEQEEKVKVDTRTEEVQPNDSVKNLNSALAQLNTKEKNPVRLILFNDTCICQESTFLSSV